MGSFNIVVNNNITKEYLSLVYKYYIYTQPSVFASYYSINREESIYDKNIRSDYGITGSGELSGVKYNAYYYTPIIFSENTTRQDTNESQHGYTSQINVRFNVSIPLFDEFEPSPNDVIAFDSVIGDSKLYRVMNLERANITTLDKTYNMFRLYLEPYMVSQDEIENTVINRYGFLQNKNKFVDINIFNNIMDIFDLLTNIRKNLLLKYNSKCDGYIDINNVCLNRLNSIFDIYKDVLNDDLSFIQFLKVNTSIDNSLIKDEIIDLITNIEDHYYNQSNIVLKLTYNKYSSLYDLYKEDINNTSFLLIKDSFISNIINKNITYKYTLEYLLNTYNLLNIYIQQNI